MLTRHITFLLALLGKVTIFLSARLYLRIIEPRAIIEPAHLLLSEKTEIESHNLNIHSKCSLSSVRRILHTALHGPDDNNEQI